MLSVCPLDPGIMLMWVMRLTLIDSFIVISPAPLCGDDGTLVIKLFNCLCIIQEQFSLDPGEQTAVPD